MKDRADYISIGAGCLFSLVAGIAALVIGATALMVLRKLIVWAWS